MIFHLIEAMMLRTGKRFHKRELKLNGLRWPTPGEFLEKLLSEILRVIPILLEPPIETIDVVIAID
jgi:hypothetical protein